MSSPASRLRKVKRGPLPDTTRVPFRHAAPSQRTSEDAVSAVTTSKPARAPSDSELVGSMAARLARVEKELLTATAEIIEKDAKIKSLEKKIASLSSRSYPPPPPRPPPPPPPPPPVSDLQRRCKLLEKQVAEMEEFLNDYGMVWVGNEEEAEEEEEEWKEERMKKEEVGKDLWSPNSSLVNKPVSIDFDLIVKNIKTLNFLAGDGSSHVSTTSQRAVLKPVEAVPLTLFSNGLVLFQGPFRPYSHPATQQCVQDLMDGYFPSELQSCYPDGVPFMVNDKRSVTFLPQQRGADMFPGSGHKLGGHRGPSKLLPSPFTSSSSPHTTSTLPGPKQTVEQFLTRLPASVVRAGRVIDIRADITTLLKSSDASSKVTVVETPALQHIRSRLTTPEPPDALISPSPPPPPPPPPASLTTLRIKSRDGQKTFLLKMRGSDTIGDVWRHLRAQEGEEGEWLVLRSGVMRTTYADFSATLEQSGLTPSAHLHICSLRNYT